jgi:Tfp pilus assembly protein PilZ
VLSWYKECVTTPQRQGIRAQVALDAVIETSGAYYYAETSTLGEGGLALKTKKVFPVGTTIRIVLGKPPQLPKIDLDATVRWLREGTDVGVQFTSLSPQNKAVIAAYIQSLQQKFQPEN